MGQHVGWEGDWVKDGMSGSKHTKDWRKGEESMGEEGSRVRKQKEVSSPFEPVWALSNMVRH